MSPNALRLKGFAHSLSQSSAYNHPYPVRTFQLQEDDVAEGYELFRRNLDTYHECMLCGNWGGIEEITRPDWAKRKDYA
ncbi:hypothetical protein ACVWYR_001248 [Pantoea agglomerans]